MMKIYGHHDSLGSPFALLPPAGINVETKKSNKRGKHKNILSYRIVLDKVIFFG